MSSSSRTKIFECGPSGWRCPWQLRELSDLLAHGFQTTMRSCCCGVKKRHIVGSWRLQWGGGHWSSREQVILAEQRSVTARVCLLSFLWAGRPVDSHPPTQRCHIVMGTARGLTSASVKCLWYRCNCASRSNRRIPNITTFCELPVEMSGFNYKNSCSQITLHGGVCEPSRVPADPVGCLNGLISIVWRTCFWEKIRQCGILRKLARIVGISKWWRSFKFSVGVFRGVRLWVSIKSTGGLCYRVNQVCEWSGW